MILASWGMILLKANNCAQHQEFHSSTLTYKYSVLYVLHIGVDFKWKTL